MYIYKNVCWALGSLLVSCHLARPLLKKAHLTGASTSRAARLCLPGRVQPAFSEIVAPHNRLVHVYSPCSPRTLLSITVAQQQQKNLSHMRGSRVPARAFHNMPPCAQWRLMRGVVPADVISIAAVQESHWGREAVEDVPWEFSLARVASKTHDIKLEFSTHKLIRGAGYVNSESAQVLLPIIFLRPLNKDPEVRMTGVSWWSLQLWESVTCDVMKGQRYFAYVTDFFLLPPSNMWREWRCEQEVKTWRIFFWRLLTKWNIYIYE